MQHPKVQPTIPWTDMALCTEKYNELTIKLTPEMKSLGEGTTLENSWELTTIS
jgi:hypothetical protein